MLRGASKLYRQAAELAVAVSGVLPQMPTARSQPAPCGSLRPADHAARRTCCVLSRGGCPQRCRSPSCLRA